MIKRYRVKWDETEIPDDYYIRAADFEELENLANEVAFTHNETSKHENAIIRLREWLRLASQPDAKAKS